jgi:rubrerythrin
MIKSDEGHFLFIEPRKGAAKEPVRDELSANLREAMEHASIPNYSSFGYHECICGAKSEATDRILHTGQITNSLAVHYLEYHREEVPSGELAKVRKLCDSVRELRPTWAAAAEAQKQRSERRLKRLSNPYCDVCGGHFLGEAESHCPTCGGTVCACGHCFCDV